MTDTAPTPTVVIEREMSHASEKIWRALTEASLINQWLMSNDFEPVVGHQFNLRATPVPGWSGVIECEVLVVEPNVRLSYSWGTLGLTPTAIGTRVRMEHSGFPSEESASYKGAKYGWQKFIGKLEDVVGGMD